MKLLIETNTEWLFKKRKRRKNKKKDGSQVNEDEDEKICGKVGGTSTEKKHQMKLQCTAVGQERYMN